MVRPLDETVTVFGEGRIAKNSGVVNRINSVQVAWHHTRYAATVAIRPSRGRSGAENAQGGGDCKRDESHLATHGFLLLPRRDTDSRSGFNARKNFVTTSQFSATADPSCVGRSCQFGRACAPMAPHGRAYHARTEGRHRHGIATTVHIQYCSW
jgi:hypothetical protein